MLWRQKNQQLYVNTVVRVSAVIISDSGQTVVSLFMQRAGLHSWEVGEAAGGVQTFGKAETLKCWVPVVSTMCPLG